MRFLVNEAFEFLRLFRVTCGQVYERLWRRGYAHGLPDGVDAAHVARRDLTSQFCEVPRHLLS